MLFFLSILIDNNLLCLETVTSAQSQMGDIQSLLTPSEWAVTKQENEDGTVKKTRSQVQQVHCIRYDKAITI